MNLKSLEFLENGENYYIDTLTNSIYRKYKNGNIKLLKPECNNSGHLFHKFWKNNKYKKHYLHRIVYQVHNGDIPEGLVIDHIDHNKVNNNIENLRAVTVSFNIKNRKGTGKYVYEYTDNIGKTIKIDDGVFYSITNDKFYLEIGELFRSMTEHKHKGICWYNNKKQRYFMTNKFRKELINSGN